MSKISFPLVQTLVMPKAWKLFKACQSVRVEKDWEIEFSLYSIVFSSLQYKHKIGFSEISTPQKNTESQIISKKLINYFDYNTLISVRFWIFDAKNCQNSIKFNDFWLENSNHQGKPTIFKFTKILVLILKIVKVQ